MEEPTLKWLVKDTPGSDLFDDEGPTFSVSVPTIDPGMLMHPNTTMLNLVLVPMTVMPAHYQDRVYQSNIKIGN